MITLLCFKSVSLELHTEIFINKNNLMAGIWCKVIQGIILVLPKRHSNIACSADLAVLNSFSFYMPKHVSISPAFLKNIFARQNSTVMISFLEYFIKIFFHCLLAYMVHCQWEIWCHLYLFSYSLKLVFYWSVVDIHFTLLVPNIQHTVVQVTHIIKSSSPLVQLLSV